MTPSELFSKKLMNVGTAFAQVRASGADDGDNFRFTNRGAVSTSVGDGSGPPVNPYQDTPVIVCVITG